MAKSKDLFPVYTPRDLRKHKPNPEDFIAGDGWIKRKKGTLLIGATGMGKSVLAEQLGICLAAGQPFFGVQIKDPQSVLYIEAENDADVLQRDVTSIIDHLKLKDEALDKNFKVCHAYAASGNSFLMWLDDMVRKTKPSVVIIDPYQSYVEGDTNKAETFMDWIRPVEDLMNEMNFALLIVIHKPKPKDVTEWDVRETVYLAGGTSAISNWTRSSIELFPLKTDPSRFRLHFSKSGERAGLRDEQNHIVRDLYIEHSGNPSTPYWRLSEDQRGEFKVDYKRAVEDTSRQNPKWSFRQVAEALNVSVGVVSKYYPKDLKAEKDEEAKGK